MPLRPSAPGPLPAEARAASRAAARVFSGAVWAGGRADFGSGLFLDISALAGYGRDIGWEGEARVSIAVESESFSLGVDLSVGTGETDLFRGRVSIGLRGGIGL